jgi:TPR repeat protein
VVPLNLVPQLRVRAPAEHSRSDLTLALVTFDGDTLAESRLTLFVAPPVGRIDTVPMATPPLPGMTTFERENAIKLLDRGHESLRIGNVAVAQKFYQRAAERGLAEAAIALGATYDPRELARMKLDVEPNLAMAKQWYEKARELGSIEADTKLRQLR